MNPTIRLKTVAITLIIILLCGVIAYYQTQKAGFHEDEVYSIASAVNPINGLMTAYEHNDLPESGAPVWKTRQEVRDYLTLIPENYLNLAAIYHNQAMDNHPPFFYLLVHGSAMLLGGQFSKYTVFLLNLLAFVASCLVLNAILRLLGKTALFIPTLLLYGLSMGTISMVLYQRMYMLLTLFCLLYLHQSLDLYRHNFRLSIKKALLMGTVTVLGFLTQYFFAVYAAFVFLVMLAKMIGERRWRQLWPYILAHAVYAVLGVLLFPPCIEHLLTSDRGLSNLSNPNGWEHFLAYLDHLAYSFSIPEGLFPWVAAVFFLLLAVAFLRVGAEGRFHLALLVLPGAGFFLLTVQMTSFQELRYIMPVLPFVVLALFYGADCLLALKRKTLFLAAAAVLLVANGLIFAKPKFLYEDYRQCLEIAAANSEKSFVYINDNFFTHMKSLPEMMLYQKTRILNLNRGELELLLQDEALNREDSYILSIKSYLDNDSILQAIQENTPFHSAQPLFTSGHGANDTLVESNLYLVSKGG